eukprot:1161997-Pelagomonas_calceolata.AAC.1
MESGGPLSISLAARSKAPWMSSHAMFPCSPFYTLPLAAQHQLHTSRQSATSVCLKTALPNMVSRLLDPAAWFHVRCSRPCTSSPCSFLKERTDYAS